MSSLSRTPTRVLPEVQILILCARSEGGDLSLAAGDQTLDWEKVLEYAQIHGVLQFVVAALDRKAIAVPEQWKGILALQHRRNVTRAMIQHRECSAILGALARSGIRAVPFKGTSLSKLLYGRVADRVSSDIDILVSEAEFLRARGVMEGLGYAAADEGSRLDTETLLSSGNEMIFRNSNGIIAELHWRLFEHDRACGFAIRFEDLHINGDHFEDEDLFMILVLHGLTHRWEAVKWIVDIDAFVRNVSVRWEVLFERAVNSGTMRATAIALLLANDVLGSPLPLPIADRTAQRLARRYARTLLTGGRIPPLADFWMQIAARERWIDRLRFVRFVATPKPWDHIAPGPTRLSRLIRLMSQSFRTSQLSEVQKIPELRRPTAVDEE